MSITLKIRLSHLQSDFITFSPGEEWAALTDGGQELGRTGEGEGETPRDKSCRPQKAKKQQSKENRLAAVVSERDI